MPRTSALQFEIMVDFMERNGDLSKPTTDGPSGRLSNIKRWEELASILNADATGDTKNMEKWRKVWSDLKNNTKRKRARILQSVSGTGGGPACKIKLTDLEDRVLNIIGPQAASGIPEVPEIGLYQEIIPAAPSQSLPLAPPPAQETPEFYFELHQSVIGSQREPAGSLREAAGSLREPAGSLRAAAGSLREPASSLREPAGSLREPAGSLREPAGSLREAAGNLREAAGSLHEPDAGSSYEPVAGNSYEPVAGSSYEPVAGSSYEQVAGSSHELVAGSSHELVVGPQTPNSRRRITSRRRLTPGRRRLEPNAASSAPVQRRRARLQTQSELARQEFLNSDREWRAFFMNREREAQRLREMELVQQAGWQELFKKFLATCEAMVDVMKNKNT